MPELTAIIGFFFFVSYFIPVELFIYNQRKDLIGSVYCVSLRDKNAHCYIYSQRIIGSTPMVNLSLPCSGKYQIYAANKVDNNGVQDSSTLASCSDKHCLHPMTFIESCSKNAKVIDVSLLESTTGMTPHHSNTDEVDGLPIWQYVIICAVAVFLICFAIAIFCICKKYQYLCFKPPLSTLETTKYSESPTKVFMSGQTIVSADQGLGPSSISGSSVSLSETEGDPFIPQENEYRPPVEERDPCRDSGRTHSYTDRYSGEASLPPLKQLREGGMESHGSTSGMCAIQVDDGVHGDSRPTRKDTIAH